MSIIFILCFIAIDACCEPTTWWVGDPVMDAIYAPMIAFGLKHNLGAFCYPALASKETFRNVPWVFLHFQPTRLSYLKALWDKLLPGATCYWASCWSWVDLIFGGNFYLGRRINCWNSWSFITECKQIK